ncbi:MAG: hypothetical protein HRT77_12800 [Halioglobus sp.]|nr:hypothetical protein [Halioglobus sp.]
MALNSSTLYTLFGLVTSLMTPESWDPRTESSDATLVSEPGLLQRLIDFDRQDQLAQLDPLLGDDETQRLAGLMKIDHSVWRNIAETLDDDELTHLIRFFAIAEKLPGWEAGAESPVIPLAKVLRTRGVRLDKTLLTWLREFSENRFLPYGPL